MKKTLLSVLAGLTVIGAATAAPSVDDRRALCERYPDKFVWVEKDTACIPKNPCSDTDYKIKQKYCGNYGLMGGRVVPGDFEQQAWIFKRYIQNVLKTDVESNDVFIQDPDDPDEGIGIVSYRLKNGGFVAFQVKQTEYNPLLHEDWIVAVCGAYGRKATMGDPGDGHGLIPACVDVKNEKECTDIIDFASLVAGTNVRGSFVKSKSNRKSCVFHMDIVHETFSAERIYPSTENDVNEGPTDDYSTVGSVPNYGGGPGEGGHPNY